MRSICKGAMLLVLFGQGAHCAPAQDLAESAGLTSHTTMATRNAKPPSFATASPVNQQTSPHILARTGPPVEETNRKAFQDNAGEKAGKLLLRSVPSGAEIFIDDLLVGRSPLLIVIASGKYTIDMRGPRQESGRSTVGVMPNETQTIVINLNEKYPTSVTIR